jgi:2-polyprenyl-6-methoxyphenol hydroxylase-like FAD-dependent oxidoreductase
MDENESFDVAVAGAGPVGLLLAGDLAHNGVRVVVLERSPAPSSTPKANGVVGHASLELARRGILAGTGLRVVSPPRFSFGPLVLDLGFGPRNPLHILPIPQGRLEDLLERRAIDRGVQIRRAHEVIGFAQTETDVTATAATDDATRFVHARYLVGCDGARSPIRKQAGIGFPGITSDESPGWRASRFPPAGSR